MPKVPVTVKQQRINELVYRLHNYTHSDSARFNESWKLAVIELAQIGEPAVATLTAVLDRTGHDVMMQSIAFTLRGIGDPRAVPSLIRALPRTAKIETKRGLTSAGKPLEFKVEGSQGSRYPLFLHGRSAQEIAAALEALTGHTEGRDYVTGGSVNDPETMAKVALRRQDAAGRWQRWWLANEQRVMAGTAQASPPAAVAANADVIVLPPEETTVTDKQRQDPKPPSPQVIVASDRPEKKKNIVPPSMELDVSRETLVSMPSSRQEILPVAPSEGEASSKPEEELTEVKAATPVDRTLAEQEGAATELAPTVIGSAQVVTTVEIKGTESAEMVGHSPQVAGRPVQHPTQERTTVSVEDSGTVGTSDGAPSPAGLVKASGPDEVTNTAPVSRAAVSVGVLSREAAGVLQATPQGSGWGEAVDGLRCRWEPPTTTGPGRPLQVIAMELQNVSDETVYWECRKQVTWRIRRPGTTVDYATPTFDVGFGAGSRTATVGEVRDHLNVRPVGIAEDAVVRGFYAIEPGAGLTLSANCPWNLPDHGTVKLDGHLSRYYQLGWNLDLRQVTVTCPMLIIRNSSVAR